MPRIPEQADLVIVGAGSAGSALANRLSVDPTRRVLVLEAGRVDWWFDPLIHMPAALPFPIKNPVFEWRFISVSEPELGGRYGVWGIPANESSCNENAPATTG